MSKLIPKNTIRQIKLLRQKGYSLPEIASELNVAKSSAYRHIQDIAILPMYWKVWHGKQGGSIKRMKLAEEKAIIKAKESIRFLTEKEKMIFLTALYWGEGSKNDFGLSNTDPDLIKVFVTGLRQIFNVKQEDLRISVRIYEDLNKDLCLVYWSKITGVPVDKFVNVNILTGKKKGKLQYGMCRVRITKGADLLKYVIALRKEIFNHICPRSSTERTGAS